MDLHPDRICKWCGHRTKYYGPGIPGCDKDGYRCMKYLDLKMWRKRPEGQLTLPLEEAQS